MITNAPINAKQTQPVHTNVHISRIRALRILGGAQIGLSVICVILGVVGVILSYTEKNKRFQSYYNNYTNGYYNVYYDNCRDETGNVILYSICMAFSGWVSNTEYEIVLLLLSYS